MEKLNLRLLRELHTVGPAQKGRPAFVSAASGLVLYKNQFYMVADDELSLAIFPRDLKTKGKFYRLLSGDLPLEYKARKKQKPDFEALVLCPEKNFPKASFLALPSGSKPNRIKGAIWCNEECQLIDLSSLYQKLGDEISELNIEGAVFTGDTFKIFQRGNGGEHINAVITLDLNAVIQDLKMGQISSKTLLDIRYGDIGKIGKIHLSYTDACLESQNKIWFVAVGEDTLNTYDDGEYAGAVLGWMDQDSKIHYLTEIDCPSKPEGLAIDVKAKKFYVVTDADDVGKVSALFEGDLPS